MCGKFGHKRADCPNKKHDSENNADKKEKDLMEDVCIVEDGVINVQTTGTTRKSLRDRKIKQKTQT